jgi:hypothetical protein
MKKLFAIVLLLSITLASAYAEDTNRSALELSILADLAYAPAGIWTPGAPLDQPPLFLCDLGLGLRLAGGALFLRASASVSVPAEDLIRYGTPATLLAKRIEVGSNPFPGVEVGLRFIDAGAITGSVYIRIEQNIKLF